MICMYVSSIPCGIQFVQQHRHEYIAIGNPRIVVYDKCDRLTGLYYLAERLQCLWDYGSLSYSSSGVGKPGICLDF